MTSAPQHPDLEYRSSLDGIEAEELVGFFEGWPTPPSGTTHLEILRGSSHRLIAVDRGSKQILGFITALSDGVLSAYISLLEVLPDYRGLGIGRELTRRMLEELKGLYMVDLVCDPAVAPFYEQLGMTPLTGMAIRRPEALRS